MKVEIVNIKDDFSVTKTAEYIGRGNSLIGRKASPLANPFKIGRDGDRAEVIYRYGLWLNAAVRAGNRDIIIELVRLATIGRETGTVRLACFCAPLPCHGDVVAEFIRAIEFPGAAK